MDELVDDVRRLNARITAIEQLGPLVKPLAPGLLELYGVSTVMAAGIIGHAGSLRRCRNANAFAMRAGVAPITSASGRSNAVRLNTGGNRQLNRCLHVIAITQVRAPVIMAMCTTSANEPRARPIGPPSAHSSDNSPRWSSIASSMRAPRAKPCPGSVQPPPSLTKPFGSGSTPHLNERVAGSNAQLEPTQAGKGVYPSAQPPGTDSIEFKGDTLPSDRWTPPLSSGSRPIV